MSLDSGSISKYPHMVTTHTQYDGVLHPRKSHKLHEWWPLSSAFLSVLHRRWSWGRGTSINVSFSFGTFGLDKRKYYSMEGFWMCRHTPESLKETSKAVASAVLPTFLTVTDSAFPCRGYVLSCMLLYFTSKALLQTTWNPYPFHGQGVIKLQLGWSAH